MNVLTKLEQMKTNYLEMFGGKRRENVSVTVLLQSLYTVYFPQLSDRCGTTHKSK